MSSDHWTVRGRVPFYLVFALSLTAALALIVATGRNVTYAGRSSNFVAPSQSLDAPLDPARSVTAAGGLSWQFDTLVSSATPTSGVYFGNSLELDASDVPHVGYYDHLNGDLVYAYRSGSAWQTTTVDSADDVGMHTSLALDSGGYPHISYYDATNWHLKYARSREGHTTGKGYLKRNSGRNRSRWPRTCSGLSKANEAEVDVFGQPGREAVRPIGRPQNRFVCPETQQVDRSDAISIIPSSCSLPRSEGLYMTPLKKRSILDQRGDSP